MFKKLGSAVCCLLFTATAVLISLPAFSVTKDELVGTWEWSGAGCRDTDLSESSHVPQSTSVTPDSIDNATFVFNNDDTATMNFSQSGEPHNFNGQFAINGDTVTMYTTQEERDAGGFQLTYSGGWLMVVRCKSHYEQVIREENQQNNPDIQRSIDAIENTCGSNSCFVYMVGKVE